MWLVRKKACNKTQAKINTEISVLDLSGRKTLISFHLFSLSLFKRNVKIAEKEIPFRTQYPHIYFVGYSYHVTAGKT